MLYEVGPALSKIIKADLLDYSRWKYKHRIGLGSAPNTQIKSIEFAWKHYSHCSRIFDPHGEQVPGQIMMLTTIFCLGLWHSENDNIKQVINIRKIFLKSVVRRWYLVEIPGRVLNITWLDWFRLIEKHKFCWVKRLYPSVNFLNEVITDKTDSWWILNINDLIIVSGLTSFIVLVIFYNQQTKC